MNVWIKCCRDGKKVYLLIDDNHFGTIQNNVSPYFDVSLDSMPLLEDWKIYVSNTSVNIDEKWEHVRIEIPGETFYNRTFLYQKEMKSIYIEEPDDIRLKIQTAIRLCRDIIKHLYKSEKMFFLHAGMVSYNGKGICLVGDKKSGKTSSILALLSKGEQTAYISNDDLSIFESNNNAVGMGWPRAISIRRDTLQYMRNFLSSYDFNSCITHPDNNVKELSEYLYIYPREVKKIFECEVKNKSSIDIIIFPHFSTSFEIVELKPEESYRKIMENTEKNKSKYFKPFEDAFISTQKSLLSLDTLYKIRCFDVYQNIYDMEALGKWVDCINV